MVVISKEVWLFALIRFLFSPHTWVASKEAALFLLLSKKEEVK
jgi:hypothetical protein